MKSIGAKLALAFIIIFLFIISAISGILIFISVSSTKELTLGGMEYRIELQAEGLNQALIERATVVRSVADIIMNADEIDQDFIQKIISPIYNANEEYNLYVGFSDNQAFFADYWEPDSSWVATERD